ncbi:SDR family oxidoreductase [Azospirillum canadense]|uniref:SDR family oxidoreductase n=1 Tax=Azospirillum canadense TaxID=403962 RepID=UPI002227FBA8|nr:SDR family oxidoreductase [Azospirillum canadense]MCW2236597.1 short-subunit dehydrogenase [Azospirillum canadense]
MRLQLKPIEEQVIVITGASSGIGLATARMAARQGAKVVLAARDREALARVAEEIRGEGGDAVHCVADVANPEELRQLADLAVRTHGRIDTWVNNAGVSIYGKVIDTPMEDHRRLFETNYWGVVNGSLAAIPHLRRHGGALINLGSVVSDRSVPLQGAYSATKHAVKGFTDALRMELEADGVPISVTLIKPAAIDTLYEEHAKNLMDVEPSNPPPVYAPDLVAKAICHCAQTPMRDMYVGGGAKLFSLAETFAPRITDYVMERAVTRATRSGGPLRARNDALHSHGDDGRERAGRHRFVRETSFYTEAQMHPWMTVALLAGVGVLAGAAMSRGWVRGGYGEHRGEDRHRARRLGHREHGRFREDYYSENGGHRTLGHNAKPAWQAAEESEVTFPR